MDKVRASRAGQTPSREAGDPGLLDLDGAGGAPALLRVDGASKSFGGAKAIEDVSLQLELGHALGIVGENGAGKSTLMKILAGVYAAGTYEGTVTLRGEQVRFRSVQEARDAGIVLIPQELHIAPELSIAENMFAGVLPARIGFVDTTALDDEARTWLGFFDLAFDPSLPASVLSPSEQRLVLIAGALSQRARVLILDEPTASLSDGEAQKLFAHVARLRDEGIGILFISHRLDDITQVCDQVLVMRNGRAVAFFAQRNAPRDEIVAAMIGRSHDVSSRRPRRALGTATRLEITGIRVRDPYDNGRYRVDGVDLAVQAGEIVCLFGLVGAGRTEILQALFGVWPGAVSGTFSVDGNPYMPRNPRHAIRSGIALLTENRKQTGIFPGHSLTSNFDAASIDRVSRLGFVRENVDLDRSLHLMKRLDVRARTVTQPIETLSGGNQQKVLLGRWLASEPRVLLLDEPTVGVDVGAREEIYQRIEELAENGCAVLLVSSDLDEVLRMCDRTLVMYKGRLTATIEGRPTRHELMSAATGGR
jgi:ABC-type sugar transport system ATPase subunit